ncbi:MAG: hypothetical protein LBU90_10090 [Bacteroidales bacterium]|jgi:hypothetical protein|nr:hypothetical protein [Bacteroidales bacterium]
MKHLHFLTIIAAIVAFTTSCIKDETCINCTAEDIIIQKFVIDPNATSGDGTITVYPVFTPRNYNFCDSFVYMNHSWVEPYKKYSNLLLCTAQQARDTFAIYRQAERSAEQPCVCRKNPDTEYNTTGGKSLNDFLYIDGISQFPNSVMNIRVPRDTSKILTLYNYDNQNGVFNGLILRTENTTIVESKMLASGIYEAELMFYKDAAHQVILGDTVRFKLAIIRSPRVNNINCLNEAREKGDNEILH